MIKKILKLTLIIIAAAAVGVFADQVLWPRFVTQPLLAKFDIGQAPVQVVERQQTTIVENTALVGAIDKVSKTVVVVKSTSAKGAVASGAGLVLTSDGVAVTSTDLLPLGGEFEVSVNGQNTTFEVVKRDQTLGLALIKIKASDLSSDSFYPLENLKLGARVFLLGSTSGQNFANEGIVRSFAADSIQTSIIEKAAAKGSVVFDIEGNIIGIASVDKSGWVNIIPISKIKAFAGL